MKAVIDLVASAAVAIVVLASPAVAVDRFEFVVPPQVGTPSQGGHSYFFLLPARFPFWQQGPYKVSGTVELVDGTSRPFAGASAFVSVPADSSSWIIAIGIDDEIYDPRLTRIIVDRVARKDQR